jgi:hypothetical protein
MAKRSIRKVHIDGDIWTWVAQAKDPGDVHEGFDVRVYSPTKRMYRIDGDQVSVIKEEDGTSNHYIRPGKVKKYILQKILNRTK